MKTHYLIIVIVLLTLLIIVLQNNMAGKQQENDASAGVSASLISVSSTTMKLTSNSFMANQSIPSIHTCDGKNLSPELSIEDVPTLTKSLVLLMNDPDVPTSIKPDGNFDHWVMYDIEPDAKVIPEGRSIGTNGNNGAGKLGYIGPCPPDREHRYFFKLYALDVKLGFPEGKTRFEILAAIGGHVLESAELVGLYDRKKQ